MFGGSLVMVLTRNGAEINDAGYAPVSLRLSAPQSLKGSNARVVTNRESLRFGPWSEDSKAPVDGWEIRDSAGTSLATGLYLRRETFARGDEAVFQERTIILGLR